MIHIHLATVILVVSLAWLAWTDARSFRLPDIGTLPLIVAGVVLNTLWLGTPWTSLIGAALGYGSFVAIEIGYRHLRGRDGLGRGDAKLMGAAGAWCGGWLLPLIVLIGTLGALVFIALLALLRRRLPDGSQPWPFGPWLALGFFAGWLHRAYGPGLYPGF
ncbi:MULTISPECIES: A24 family peptidase [Maricaulis]|uniref:Peptidase A24A, prepilin type IV n=1 Tax=Maricaulis maris (strain MCS10) TaxID=394221 RepID=Q0ASQ2_MARMM|nr:MULTISPECIES: A24 family peptidase [Maricaulis]ABI64685.1 peptidase A24A, prepilin type IV [Maricaulis maris MCS10]